MRSRDAGHASSHFLESREDQYAGMRKDSKLAGNVDCKYARARRNRGEDKESGKQIALAGEDEPWDP